MEEDIKILEEIIECYKECFVEDYEMYVDVRMRLRDLQAIEHLISSYKKLEKENKESKNDISNMYDEKVVRNILEELGLSKMEIEEILN